MCDGTDLHRSRVCGIGGTADFGAIGEREPKTARQCNSDWAANKTAIQASGKTKRAFVAECRGITVAARQSPALDKGQYTSEAEAKAKVGLITHSPGNIPLDACDFEAPRG